MSRADRHIGLERTETAIHEGGAVRRAALEEQIQAALADGDREQVSLLRQRLEALATAEPVPGAGRPERGPA